LRIGHAAFVGTGIATPTQKHKSVETYVIGKPPQSLSRLNGPKWEILAQAVFWDLRDRDHATLLEELTIPVE
jgi:hypothetical protein